SITDGSVQCYFDGHPDTSATFGAWTWPVGLEIDLGLTQNTAAYSAYDGQMDDVRFYNRILTSNEVASVFTSGSLIDTSALKLQLNFPSGKIPGLTATWLLGTDILQSAPNVTGPYADVPSAASPYRFEPLGKQQYFRYRHTKSTVITNPTDM
ncbi:MAG TPA: LamG-like jellyroll fold domain-containing protein, partial [Opitutaceae bacterium]|nr:LamG-like jellyroll fold domain-containing protein [Opitutaceae bacterium]